MPAADEAFNAPYDTSETDDLEELILSDEDAPETTRARAYRLISDQLYGEIPVSRWADALIDLEPFRRLDGVSLSDVPGEILVGDLFPSRLTHSLGVYYLARQARPRDRALHVAALAHDLGHGPFSHLTEPLMLERLSLDHEQRSAALLREAVASARGPVARQLAWLDLDEICALITGESLDGRGELLNGLLDYDNIDNVARFAFAAGLAEPGYDGRALARALRLAPGAADDPAVRVAVADDAAAAALAWQEDRATVYRFLQTDAWNVAAHAMLRKAVDLAASANRLDEGFFDLTDAEALTLLRSTPAAEPFVEGVIADKPYVVIWESLVPANGAVVTRFRTSAGRLNFEESLAMEAGLRPSEIIATYVISRVARNLPPYASQAPSSANTPQEPAERFVRVLAPAEIGRDYIRRARMAAERALGV